MHSDKAYVDFPHLAELDERGVFWITRTKDNIKYRVIKILSKAHDNIIKDQRIASRFRANTRGWSSDGWMHGWRWKANG